MKNILVTGANGQLGLCIKKAASGFPDYNFVFVGKKELDISNSKDVLEFFKNRSFHYCINTAAYTKVEKAETESDAALAINAYGVKNLSEACKKHNTILLHISTDYVFDGTQSIPYQETDETNPINVYGASKLAGEVLIQENCDKYFIIRTSWLYSQYGNNFMRSVLNWAKEGRSLTITTEQTGTPTNANNLAEVLMQLISLDVSAFGVYHFSNDGEATWYDFAERILKFSKNLDRVQLSKTNSYPTKAKRPVYSCMDTSKLERTLKIKMHPWEKSLKNLIENESNQSLL